MTQLGQSLLFPLYYCRNIDSYRSIQGRILALAHWLRAFSRSGFRNRDPGLHRTGAHLCRQHRFRCCRPRGRAMDDFLIAV